MLGGAVMYTSDGYKIAYLIAAAAAVCCLLAAVALPARITQMRVSELDGAATDDTDRDRLGDVVTA